VAMLEYALWSLLESTDVATKKYVWPPCTVVSTYCVVVISVEFNWVYGPPETVEL